jgi:hypothetical protein
MLFKYIHFYSNPANTLDLDNIIVPEIQNYFPNCTIDTRQPLLTNIDDIIAESLVSMRVSEIKKPYNEQPDRGHQPRLKNIEDAAYEKNFPRRLIVNDFDPNTNTNTTARQYKELILYDGFMMQRLLGTMIPENEATTEHVHVVIEDRLICTFSEQDWSYHARAVVCGVPAIISTTGIVEAPAKPKEWYVKQMQFSIYGINPDEENNEISNKKEFTGNKYLDYCDDRINLVTVGYVLQALFFFISDGDPFCNDRNCRLFDAHWQEELIHSQIENEKLCNKHASLLHQFNIG